MGEDFNNYLGKVFNAVHFVTKRLFGWFLISTYNHHNDPGCMDTNRFNY